MSYSIGISLDSARTSAITSDNQSPKFVGQTTNRELTEELSNNLISVNAYLLAMFVQS